MMELSDRYGRKFETLRVSLLSTCNLGCVYCTMGDGEELAFDHRPQKSAAELLGYIAALHEALGLKTIRLTGGEPLLYRELPGLIAGIQRMQIPRISMTTNAFLLQRQARELKDAGLQTVNISLDALNKDIFFKISRRRQLQKVLAGIDAAISCGLQVKINSVIMKGINETEIVPLLEYAFQKNVPIRFLEVMAMGHLHDDAAAHLVSQQDILDAIGMRYHLVRLPRGESSTANYWQTHTGHVFGIIANESEPFCTDCNRLRLDAGGNIYGCLSADQGIALNDIADKAALQQKLQQAMQQKQALKFTGSSMSMLSIGG